MRWAKLSLLAVLALAGCFKPLQTDVKMTMTRPLTTAIEPRGVAPVVEMAVEGQGHWPGPTIAIVDVDGLLLNENMTGPMSAGENPVDLFRERLDAVAADPKVCAVVLRINSPGGGVTASDIMWNELQKFRRQTHKPVVACIMDLGCGGAYYLATACDAIIAHPTSVTGAIGVVLNLYNLELFLENFNISPQFIKAGAHIDMGTLFNELKEDSESRRILQSMADEFHSRFQKIVGKQRSQVDTTKDTTFDGRVFNARQALELKLIDHIGYMDDALAFARSLSNEPYARASMFHRCNDIARTPYAATPNFPISSTLFPMNIPGVDRHHLPTFLYLWEPDPGLLRWSGK
jgi:protease-4